MPWLLRIRPRTAVSQSFTEDEALAEAWAYYREKLKRFSTYAFPRTPSVDGRGRILSQLAGSSRSRWEVLRLNKMRLNSSSWQSMA